MHDGHDHDHDHDHAHDHAHDGHDHDHARDGREDDPERGHAHPHDPAPSPGSDGVLLSAPLREGEGEGCILFADAFSGVAGDMMIAALLDLGVPLQVVEGALAALPIEGFHLHRGLARKNAIVATSFEVHLDGPQPLRTWSTIDAMLAAAPLAEPVRSLSRRIFRRLGEAEAAVHRTRLEDVHFHEVGAVDAIVDIVGSAAALCWLGAEVVASPLPMGRGFVRAAHGVLPLPAPAVVSCLAGCPTVPVALDAELVTPTGAAIVASVAGSFARWPVMRPRRAGFGAGKRDLPDRPNLLRLVLGDPEPEAPGARAAGASHVVVEANVDDLTGELAAHALDALRAAGALDAWAVPITMKKGRPGLVLSALCPAALEGAVAAAMLQETSSIGVRLHEVARLTRPRRMVEVPTAFGPIPVKISEGPYGPPQQKPEFEACASAARRAGVPVREVIAAALAAARATR